MVTHTFVFLLIIVVVTAREKARTSNGIGDANYGVFYAQIYIAII
jgi:hypothetical protein